MDQRQEKIATEVAVWQPYLISLWKKLTCSCKSLCFAFVRGLNKISSGIFELRFKDTEKIATKWQFNSHIWSYHIMNWCAYVSHSALPLFQVWTKSVQGYLNYGSKTRKKNATKWPPCDHIWSYRKKNWRAYVGHSVLPLCQVWAKSIHTCLSYGSKTWKNAKKNGRLAPIFDRIAKKIYVHM